MKIKTTKTGKVKNANKNKSKEREEKINKLMITDTHYLLILDESGSMGKVKQQTLNGLNEQIQTIKSLEIKYPTQKYFISIVKFNTEITPLIIDVPASEVKELKNEDYNPNQKTSLHDAIGISTSELKKRIQTKLDKGIASAVIVIMTDGVDNDSKEYKAEDIKIIIDELNKTNLYTFSFIGSDQDTILTSKRYGISDTNTMTYTSDIIGTTDVFNKLNSAISGRAYAMSINNLSNVGYLSDLDKLDKNLKK